MERIILETMAELRMKIRGREDLKLQDKRDLIEHVDRREKMELEKLEVYQGLFLKY